MRFILYLVLYTAFHVFQSFGTSKLALSSLSFKSLIQIRSAGQLFFLKTGILFHSQTTILYLTSTSTQAAFLVHNFEGFQSAESTNVSLICPTSEPYYGGDCETAPEKTEKKGGQEPLFISFYGIDREMSSSIVQHAKRYGIGLNEVEQDWYNLEDDQPMSSWMPPRDRKQMAESLGRSS